MSNFAQKTSMKGCSEAETNMVWNVKIVVGQSDAVPAHFVDQVFPENQDLLSAVLDPEKRWSALVVFQRSGYQWKPGDLPARVRGEHRKRHPLSELLSDVIGQRRPGEDRFIYNCPKQVNPVSRSRLTSAEWRPDQGLQGREQRGSDCCRFKENVLKTKQR